MKVCIMIQRDIHDLIEICVSSLSDRKKACQTGLVYRDEENETAQVKNVDFFYIYLKKKKT